MAAYGFNEGSGTLLTDLSGNANNGTISGATWTTSGKYGNALSFNGTNALVTVNNAASLQLTSAMTLEAWVYPTTVSSAWRDVIYKGNDNYYLEGTSSNSSRPAAGAILGGVYGEVYGTAALTANTWAHLAVAYDGTTMRLYVNGVQVASHAQTGAIATSTNPLQIGGDSLYGQYFAGRIDEARIYNRALSVAEIQSDMNSAGEHRRTRSRQVRRESYGDGIRCEPGQPELDGVNGQRGGDGLSGGAAGFRKPEFCAGGDEHQHERQ